MRTATHTILSVLLLSGCTEPDPLDVAWNQVFEVTWYGRVEDSCAIPAKPSDSPERFVGVGLGSTFDGVFNATSYWCESTVSCSSLPFSNAVLDTVTEQELLGFFVETSFDSRRECIATWAGIDAQRTADELILVTRFHNTTSMTLETSEGCEDFAVSLIDKECSETILVRARPVTEL